jgi:hypothetical protein
MGGCSSVYFVASGRLSFIVQVDRESAPFQTPVTQIDNIGGLVAKQVETVLDLNNTYNLFVIVPMLDFIGSAADKNNGSQYYQYAKQFLHVLPLPS